MVETIDHINLWPLCSYRFEISCARSMLPPVSWWATHSLVFLIGQSSTYDPGRCSTLIPVSTTSLSITSLFFCLSAFRSLKQEKSFSAVQCFLTICTHILTTKKFFFSMDTISIISPTMVDKIIYNNISNLFLLCKLYSYPGSRTVSSWQDKRLCIIVKYISREGTFVRVVGLPLRQGLQIVSELRHGPVGEDLIGGRLHVECRLASAALEAPARNRSNGSVSYLVDVTSMEVWMLWHGQE